MKINCIIVDDEESAVEIIIHHSKKVPVLNVLASFTSPVEALAYLNENKNKVDLVFLDITMPDINGLEFIKLIDSNIKVILCTAYAQYALEGHEFGVLDYLMKPISLQNILKAVQRFPEPSILKKDEESFFMVTSKIKNSHIKIYHHEIIYLESQLNRVKIVTASEEEFKILMPMRDFEEKLSEDFIRIHNSFIVRLKQIKRIEKGCVVIAYQDKTFPIGIRYKENLMKHFEGNNIKFK